MVKHTAAIRFPMAIAFAFDSNFRKRSSTSLSIVFLHFFRCQRHSDLSLEDAHRAAFSDKVQKFVGSLLQLNQFSSFKGAERHKASTCNVHAHCFIKRDAETCSADCEGRILTVCFRRLKQGCGDATAMLGRVDKQFLNIVAGSCNEADDAAVPLCNVAGIPVTIDGHVARLTTLHNHTVALLGCKPIRFSNEVIAI